ERERRPDDGRLSPHHLAPVEERVDAPTHELDEEAEAEEAEDDGGDARQVVDGAADQPRVPGVGRGVLVQEDRGDHAHWDDGRRHQEHEEDRAEDGGEDATGGHPVARGVREELPAQLGKAVDEDVDEDEGEAAQDHDHARAAQGREGDGAFAVALGLDHAEPPSFARRRRTYQPLSPLKAMVRPSKRTPSTKSTVQCGPPTTTSPISAAMVAGTVRTGKVGSQERMAAFPEAISTIIVSPMARPKPRTIAAKMPGEAAGRTTDQAVRVRDAPRAKAASRYLCGTAVSASSLRVKITGTMVRPMPIPATMVLSRYCRPKRSCRCVARTMSTKNPSTTEGMPARSSTAGLTISRTRRGASSEVKTAPSTATGTAKIKAISATLKVPTSRGRRLYLGTFETGCHA